MKILSRVLIATVLAGAVFVPTYVYSDAPPRVHLANALGLFLAFWVPALLIRSWKDLKARAVFFVGCAVFGTLVWDAVTAAVIVKREFLMGAAIVYPLFSAGCFALFAIQAGVLKALKLESV